MNTISTVVIKKYQRSYYCKEELIYKLLKLIEKHPQSTDYQLRKEIEFYPQQLGKFLKELTYCNAVVKLAKTDRKGASCYTITEKGETLALKYNILLSLLPDVWRAE